MGLGDSAAGQVWYTLPGIALKPLGCGALLCLQAVDTFLPHWLWAGLRDSLWLVERGRSTWGEGLNVLAWFLLSLSAPPPALRTASSQVPWQLLVAEWGLCGQHPGPSPQFLLSHPAHLSPYCYPPPKCFYSFFSPWSQSFCSRIWPIQLPHGLTYLFFAQKSEELEWSAAWETNPCLPGARHLPSIWPTLNSSEVPYSIMPALVLKNDTLFHKTQPGLAYSD